MPEPDFYVGYQTQAAPVLAGFLRRVVVLLLLLAVGVASAVAVLQNRFDPGDFEYGEIGHFAGVLHELPYPTLRVDPAVSVGDGVASSFLLVASGKHGAEGEVRGLDGQHVVLEGTLVHRQGESMIEVVAGSVAAQPSSAPTAVGLNADLGIRTLRGEIVDSKCFLGVMKPGRGKTHRACAARCISGGVPPVLRVETAEGGFLHFLLTDETGGSVNDRVLDFVAEPVEITGRVRQQGEFFTLAADPAGYRRL